MAEVDELLRQTRILLWIARKEFNAATDPLSRAYPQFQERKSWRLRPSEDKMA